MPIPQGIPETPDHGKLEYQNPIESSKRLTSWRPWQRRLKHRGIPKRPRLSEGTRWVTTGSSHVRLGISRLGQTSAVITFALGADGTN